MASGGFSNKPRILRGAFVEFGISLPPLLVVFQFNPLTISRTRSAYVTQQANAQDAQATQNSGFLQTLLTSSPDIRPAGQRITINPERLSFDIRLDATDKLNDGDGLTQQFGIAPQLSTLELMMMPKGGSLLTAAVSALLGGGPPSFAYSGSAAKNPPVMLFIWGRKKVLPVNITNMQIREEEFSTDLNPIRATVSVSLEVIEGPNLPFMYTEALREVMSLLNLANIGQIANTVVPGLVMFTKGSRYRSLTQSSSLTADGERLQGVDLRVIEERRGTFLHTVQGGDRLDLLAYKYYGDSTKWWQICDANPTAVFPIDLVDFSPLAEQQIQLFHPDSESRYQSLIPALDAVGAIVTEEHDLMEGVVVLTYDGQPAARKQILGTIKKHGFDFINSFQWTVDSSVAESFVFEDHNTKTSWRTLLEGLRELTGVLEVQSGLSEVTLTVVFNSAMVKSEAIYNLVASKGFAAASPTIDLSPASR